MTSERNRRKWEQDKKRYQTDPKFRAYRIGIQKRYYERNRKKCIESAKRWSRNNHEKVRAIAHRWYARNKSGGLFDEMI